MSQNLLITNCRLFDAAEAEQTTSILIENGIIRQIGQIEPSDHNNKLDAEGKIIAPGFIDVHIQGAGGCDVLDATAEALTTISRTCARYGTTGFLATTVFKPDQPNHHLSLAARHKDINPSGASILGIHLEGPFISMEKKGMIQPDSICSPSMKVLEQIHQVTDGTLKMMTIAPELTESLQIIKALVSSGVIASFGHSSATYEQTLEGFDAGISHVTHLFNAMPSLHHRAPGPLVAIFSNPSVSVQMITDGVHLHPAVMKLAYEILGADRIIPITDGIQAMGLPDGRYNYNGVEYESKEGAGRYADGTLIGTSLSLNLILKRFVQFTGCPFETAIKVVTENPAKLLGIEDRKGSIAIGKDADLVLVDREFTVYATIIEGNIVYEK
ncbi:MAG: N-acetylglucosamine-6-phosphate deacetylase [Sedimentisphaerales bacterium]|nr:N-acetylglucosamine-6-phosphate deacetylase [Sedimentisphaerales bacterium]